MMGPTAVVVVMASLKFAGLKNVVLPTRTVSSEGGGVLTVTTNLFPGVSTSRQYWERLVPFTATPELKHTCLSSRSRSALISRACTPYGINVEEISRGCSAASWLSHKCSMVSRYNLSLMRKVSPYDIPCL